MAIKLNHNKCKNNSMAVLSGVNKFTGKYRAFDQMIIDKVIDNRAMRRLKKKK